MTEFEKAISETAMQARIDELELKLTKIQAKIQEKITIIDVTIHKYKGKEKDQLFDLRTALKTIKS